MWLPDIRTDRQLYAVALFFIGVIAVCIACLTPCGDVTRYWEFANNVLVDHRMPYSDMPFEYPPLALLVFIVPRLVSWDLASYNAVFALFCAVAFMISLHFSFKIADRFGISHVVVTFIFIIAALAMSVFIASRYDIFPVTLTIIAIYLFLTGREKTAFLVIGLAAALKLYPALIGLVFILSYITRREYARMLQGFVIIAGVCLLTELPFLINDPGTALDWLTYHSDRGIQVESVIGSFISICNIFDPSCCSVAFNYGSFNLTGPLADSFSRIMNPVMLLSAVAFAVLLAYIFSRTDLSDTGARDKIIVLASCAVVVIFVVFNKVYSAQYGVWIMLLLPLCLYGDLRAGGSRKMLVAVILFIVLSGIAAYAACIYEWGTLNAGVTVLEVLKNISTIAVLACLLDVILKISGISFGNRDSEKTDSM